MAGWDVFFMLVGMVLGGLAVWAVSRGRAAAAYGRGRAELELSEATLQEKLATRDRDLAEAGQQIDRMTQEQQQARERVQSLSVELAQLQAISGGEKKHAEEKLAFLEQAREKLKTDFESLANRIFEEKARRFTDQSKTTLGGMLTPLREQLGDFRKRVEDVHEKQVKDRSVLLTEIAHLKDLNQQVSKDAVNLANALKGESKTQGNWGEFILEKVLEKSGLEKGREYDVQVSAHSEDGRRRAPDVIVRLPENKDVIIDAKVSLTAYERYCSAETEDGRVAAAKEHVESVQRHLKQLGEKRYEDLESVRSLDFVLMFLPIEGALQAAMTSDADLYNKALEKNIIMVTPANLLATLRIIRNMWRTEYQNRHAAEIADKAGALYDKFVGFVGDLEGIGEHIDKAKQAFTDGHKKLVSGRGNLVKRSQDLVKMGVKAKKQLPQHLLDNELDDAPGPEEA